MESGEPQSHLCLLGHFLSLNVSPAAVHTDVPIRCKQNHKRIQLQQKKYGKPLKFKSALLAQQDSFVMFFKALFTVSKWQGVAPSMLSQAVSMWRDSFPSLATEKLSHLGTLCAV